MHHQIRTLFCSTAILGVGLSLGACAAEVDYGTGQPAEAFEQDEQSLGAAPGELQRDRPDPESYRRPTGRAGVDRCGTHLRMPGCARTVGGWGSYVGFGGHAGYGMYVIGNGYGAFARCTGRGCY
jgi:hypothetical protein